MSRGEAGSSGPKGFVLTVIVCAFALIAAGVTWVARSPAPNPPVETQYVPIAGNPDVCDNAGRLGRPRAELFLTYKGGKVVNAASEPAGYFTVITDKSTGIVISWQYAASGARAMGAVFAAQHGHSYTFQVAIKPGAHGAMPDDTQLRQLGVTDIVTRGTLCAWDPLPSGSKLVTGM